MIRGMLRREKINRPLAVQKTEVENELTKILGFQGMATKRSKRSFVLSF